MGSTNRQLLLHMLDYADQIEEANNMLKHWIQTLYTEMLLQCVCFRLENLLES